MSDRRSSRSLVESAPALGHGGTIDAQSELPVNRMHNSFTVRGSGIIRALTPLPRAAAVFLNILDYPAFINSAKLICPGGIDLYPNAGDIVLARPAGDGVWRLFRLSAKPADYVKLTDYGIKNDGADYTAQFQKAIDATPAQATLLLPNYLVNVGLGASGSAIFTMTKAIYIEGQGAASLVYVNASVPNTCDCFLIAPTVSILGGGFKNLQILGVGGVPVCKNMIHIDTTANTAAAYRNFLMEEVFIGAPANGFALFCEGRSDSVGGNTFLSRVKGGRLLGGAKITYGGDGLDISSTFTGANPGLVVSQIAGAGNLVVSKSIFATSGTECVIIDSGVKPVLAHCEFEHKVNGALTGSGIINFRGATATILNPTLFDCQIQVAQGGIGDPNPIYVGDASDTLLLANRVNAWNGSAHVVSSASAVRTKERDNVWNDQNTVVSLKMTDLGSQTRTSFQLHSMSGGLQINGGMDVSQENGTAAVTLTASGSLQTKYIVDGVMAHYRGSFVATAQQVLTSVAGNPFPGVLNTLLFLVTTAQASLGANDELSVVLPIEGLRAARMSFGNANARPLSIGFWANFHRAGTYSGSIRNSAKNRSYPFSFTVAADTPKWISLTNIVGDTSGTWLKDNGVGLYVAVCLAGGSSRAGTANAWAASDLSGVTGTTNGVAATSDVFYLSNVMVVPGLELPGGYYAVDHMRPFEEDLRLSRRYWQKSYDYATAPGAATNIGAVDFNVGPATTSALFATVAFPEMRAAPSNSISNIYDLAGASGKVYKGANGKTAVISTISTKSMLAGTSDATSSAEVAFQYVLDARLL